MVVICSLYLFIVLCIFSVYFIYYLFIALLRISSWFRLFTGRFLGELFFSNEYFVLTVK